MSAAANPDSRAAVKSGFASVLATLGGNAFLILGSALFGSLAILGSWLPPQGNWVFLMARWWSRGLLACSGVGLVVHQDGGVEPNRCHIFMPNHQSLYDIPTLIASLPGQGRFFAKRSLFQIPIFGWALKVGGFIAIDRQDRSRARESFAAAAKRLQEGVSTVIFPEGTRSLDGEMLPFERGGFLLALKSGVPIVPVGIRGSLGIRKRADWKVTPGTITVTYGRPIQIADFTVRSRDELADKVRMQIAALAGLQP